MSGASQRILQSDPAARLRSRCGAKAAPDSHLSNCVPHTRSHCGILIKQSLADERLPTSDPLIARVKKAIFVSEKSYCSLRRAEVHLPCNLRVARLLNSPVLSGRV